MCPRMVPFWHKSLIGRDRRDKNFWPRRKYSAGASGEKADGVPSASVAAVFCVVSARGSEEEICGATVCCHRRLDVQLEQLACDMELEELSSGDARLLIGTLEAGGVPAASVEPSGRCKLQSVEWSACCVLQSGRTDGAPSVLMTAGSGC